MFGDGKVVGLCASGIHLPADFLQNEIRLAADFAVRFQQGDELLEVTAEPRDLLAEVATVGKQRDLLEHALVVEIEL